MNGSVERRLEKLEAAASTAGQQRLAELIEAGRRQARDMSPQALQEERRTRFAEMQERYGLRPLRGLELRMMQGMERVLAADPEGLM